MLGQEYQKAFKLFFSKLFPLMIAALGVICLWYTAHGLENLFYDFLIRWTAKPSTKSPVILVLIDDESISKLHGRFGFPPWKREAFPEIFKEINAYEPTVLGFNGHFTPQSQESDQKIFELLQSIPNLIVGLDLTPYQNLSPRVSNFYHLDLGVVNMEINRDGILRDMSPIYFQKSSLEKGSMGGTFPSLPLSLAHQYLNKTKKHSWGLQTEGSYQKNLLIVPDNKEAQTMRFPLNKEGRFLIRWYNPNPSSGNGSNPYITTHPSIPLWMFFEKNPKVKKGLRKLFKGKIVLLGSASQYHRELYHTPLGLQHLGVDIQATAIDNLLFNQTLSRVSTLEQTFIFWFLVAVVFTLSYWRLGHGVLYTSSLMIFYCFWVYYGFSAHGKVMEFVVPESFMLLGFLSARAFREFSRDKHVRALEENISQLVSEPVFQEIQRLSHVLKPGGEQMEITSLFVDIQGFTTLAEKFSPEEVTELMNEYYTLIQDVIFNHRGTIDKFMGDGVLGIFGAPIQRENHADDALGAIEDLLPEAERLTHKWKKEKGFSTQIFISASSGPAFVGFLGPKNKLEYTAIGDTVNLCTRLQGLTRMHNTPVLLSESMVERLSQSGGLEALDEVTVRGRQTPLKIYTIPKDFFSGSGPSTD